MEVSSTVLGIAITCKDTSLEPSTAMYDEDMVKLYRDQWIICDSLSLPFALIAFYVAVSQTFYLVLKKTHSHSSSSRMNAGNRHSKIIVGMCIFASVTAFLRAGLDLRLVYGRHDDMGCNWSLKIKIVTYGLSLFTDYLVLWLRQRIFYEDPRLSLFGSKIVRTISWFMAAILILSGIPAMFLFVYGVNYVGSPVGCLAVNSDNIVVIRYISFVVGTTFFQICCLSLFIYPLIKHYQIMKVLGMECHARNSVIVLVKRTAVTASLCMVTDVLSVLTVLFLGDVGSISILIYDINIVMNILCVIFSFADWRQRFAPWIIYRNLHSDRGVKVHQVPSILSVDITSM